MGYQALLFCPDEKTARSVTQVLSELDFAVTPCTEPFAAVKKLMGEHFDAVVVDCDNEQNATLLFKSARNTVHNQSALAVAVVEGQAGVAKAFRIGANLVLTKPINLEQAKGTLRVARGLLRKNESAKPATSSAPLAPPAAPSATSAESRPVAGASDIGSSTTFSESVVPKVPVSAARPSEAATALAAGSAREDSFKVSKHEISPPAVREPSTIPDTAFAAKEKFDAAKAAAAKTEAAAPVGAGFGRSAASAPAPAREPKAKIATDVESPSLLSKTSDNIKLKPVTEDNHVKNSGPATNFTFGGAIPAESEPASGSSRKVLIAVAAGLIVASAGGYAAWMHWGRTNQSASAPVETVEQTRIEQTTSSPAPTPQIPAKATPAPVPGPVIEKPAAGSPDKSSTHASNSKAADSPKPAVSEPVVDDEPVGKEAAEPIVIKKGTARPAAKLHAANDAPAAPSMSEMVPTATGGGLPNLLDTHSNAPAPVLQTLHVSQGISRGLLVKKVQPKYPTNALRLRVEGEVELLATISKTGDISAVSLLHGDPQLSHAALDAVKQWKYKPYLLNGEPVEIQTQITVNFKLPN